MQRSKTRVKFRCSSKQFTDGFFRWKTNTFADKGMSCSKIGEKKKKPHKSIRKVIGVLQVFRSYIIALCNEQTTVY